jgi:GNAT superfamily N-acetyltransferase
LITHFLGLDEVEGYALDFAQRLVALGDSFPTTWFLLGKSGQNFADVLLGKIPPSLIPKIRLVRVAADRDTGKVTFIDSFKKLSGTVLLLDSAVHSGKSMLMAAQKIAKKGISDIITYSLIMKRNSVLVPNYFGVVIDETDRCLFQLPAIPNNRLCEHKPFGIVRALSESDTKKKFVKTGEPSIDETSFGSLLYEKEKGSHVYVFEHKGQICGVLSFSESHRAVFVDLVANSKASAYRGKGIGAALMRWAETWARSMKYEAIELWAIKKRISFYEDRDFRPLGREIMLGDTPYCLMRRKLLYNLSMVDPLDGGRAPA